MNDEEVQKNRNCEDVSCLLSSHEKPMNIVISELINALGAAFFVFLFIVRVMQASNGNLIAIPLALQSALAAFLLVMHKPVERVSHPRMAVIAWLCALLPLAFQMKGANFLYALPGLLLALWSLVALGFSFSIVPEDRGLVARGPYRFIRHPMYAGEFLSCLGLCIASGIIWNWIVLDLFAILLILRVRAELVKTTVL